MTLFKIAALLLALSAQAMAATLQPYMGCFPDTTTGRELCNLSGVYSIAKSSLTASTFTIIEDGASGGLNASSFTALYGISAATFSGVSMNYGGVLTMTGDGITTSTKSYSVAVGTTPPATSNGAGITLTAGNSGSSGDRTGGSITLQAGSGHGFGSGGDLNVHADSLILDNSGATGGIGAGNRLQVSGNVQSNSSVTASAFFGDASHLSFVGPNPWADPLAYGADITGATDASAALNATIQAQAASHGKIFLGCGRTYLVANPVLFNVESMEVESCPGNHGTIIRKSASMSSAAVVISSANIKISGLTVIGNPGNAGDNIWVTGRHDTLEDVYVSSAGAHDIRVGCNVSGCSTNEWYFVRVQAQYAVGDGMNFNDAGAPSAPNANAGSCDGCEASANGGYGYNVGSAQFNTWKASLAEQNALAGFHASSNAISTTWLGGDLENNSLLTGTAENVIIDTGTIRMVIWGAQASHVSDYGTGTVASYSGEVGIGTGKLGDYPQTSLRLLTDPNKVYARVISTFTRTALTDPYIEAVSTTGTVSYQAVNTSTGSTIFEIKTASGSPVFRFFQATTAAGNDFMSWNRDTDGVYKGGMNLAGNGHANQWTLDTALIVNGTGSGSLVDKGSATIYGNLTGLSSATFVGAAQASVFNGAGTGLTGTAASLTAGNVTTNANLTGPVTSVGNATAIGTGVVSPINLAVEVKAFGALANGSDDTTAIQNAVNTNSYIHFSSGTYTFSGTITLPSYTKIVGDGISNVTLNYTGSGAAFTTSTPGTRKYGWNIRDLTLTTTSGTTGYLLDSVSSAQFENVAVSGFVVGWDIYSPTSGFAVYNRFKNTTVTSATTGYMLRGSGSNANVFDACRVNVFTASGFAIYDSNENHINSCQIEGAGLAGVSIYSSVSALSDSNYILTSRFEGAMSTGVYIDSANVRFTRVLSNDFVSSVLLNVLDNGTNTSLLGPNLTSSAFGFKVLGNILVQGTQPSVFATRFGNAAGGTNASMAMQTFGTALTRSTNDGNPTFVVQNAGASATGSIQLWENATSTIATFAQNGAITFASTVAVQGSQFSVGSSTLIVANGGLSISTNQANGYNAMFFSSGMAIIQSTSGVLGSQIFVVQKSSNNSNPVFQVLQPTASDGSSPVLVVNRNSSASTFQVTEGGGVTQSSNLTVGGTQLTVGVSTFVVKGGNVGVSTTTPVALFTVGSSTGAFIDRFGHEIFFGPAPTVTTCGTGSPTVVGTDSAGIITTGTAAAACTLNFVAAWPGGGPICTLTDSSTSSEPAITAQTTTSITLGLSLSLSGGTIYYHCFGSQ